MLRRAPASSRTLRRIGSILAVVVHCRRIMPIETLPRRSTVRVKAGIEAQRLPSAALSRFSRKLPAETTWTGNGSSFGDIS